MIHPNSCSEGSSKRALWRLAADSGSFLSRAVGGYESHPSGHRKRALGSAMTAAHAIHPRPARARLNQGTGRSDRPACQTKTHALVFLPALPALTFAQRARCAAAIRLRPAGEMVRFFVVVAAAPRLPPCM